jgi:phospholipid/cholesterol/gamma-HCH transport system substrate-binding protein
MWAGLVGFVALSVVCTGWLFARIGPFTGAAGVLSDTYELSAAFSDATGVVANDEVRLAGVEVGRVTGVEVSRGKAIVTMVVDDSARLPRGSRFELRWKNLLGQRFVNVVPPEGAEPGGPSIADGARIAARDTGAAADLSALLNQTQPLLSRLDTASLNRVMATFAAALQGREQTLGQAMEQAADLVAMLAGRADAIGASITDFATLLEGIAGHDQEVRALLDSLASTSQVLADRSDDLGQAAGDAGRFTSALSRVLGASEGQIDTVLGQTGQVLDMVVANKAVLEKSLEQVPWATAAILRMTNKGDWIQSYTRGVGIVDAYASEPRIGADYNDTGADDPTAPDPFLGQPTIPFPALPETDLGIIAINPDAGKAPDEGGETDGGGLAALLSALSGGEGGEGS